MEQQTILIVDDDREIVRVIAKILELEGYRTLKAYDGLEALDMLVGNVVHLIMIDIMMPKMNGLAAVMKIRETNNIPIIILSAKTEETDKVLGLSMGADDYISKPFNTQEMIDCQSEGTAETVYASWSHEFGKYAGQYSYW